MATTYTEPRATTTATIALNASLSGAIDLTGNVPAGIIMPAAWTAANLTFQMSADGTTYVNVYSGGVEYQETAAASIYIPLDPATVWGARYLKIRSGTASVAVNQAAARTLTVVKRPF